MGSTAMMRDCDAKAPTICQPTPRLWRAYQQGRLVPAAMKKPAGTSWSESPDKPAQAGRAVF